MAASYFCSCGCVFGVWLTWLGFKKLEGVGGGGRSACPQEQTKSAHQKLQTDNTKKCDQMISKAGHQKPTCNQISPKPDKPPKCQIRQKTIFRKDYQDVNHQKQAIKSQTNRKPRKPPKAKKRRSHQSQMPQKPPKAQGHKPNTESHKRANVGPSEVWKCV